MLMRKKKNESFSTTFQLKRIIACRVTFKQLGFFLFNSAALVCTFSTHLLLFVLATHFSDFALSFISKIIFLQCIVYINPMIKNPLNLVTITQQ
jgi:hypothetical protein